MVVTRIVMPRQKHTSYVVIQQFANMKYLHKTFVNVDDDNWSGFVESTNRTKEEEEKNTTQPS